MTSLDTIYNFAKFQYIEKYWNKTVPQDYPSDGGVEFSTTFATEEERDAVREMEAELNTEQSIVTPALPEDTFVSGYLGTFDVQQTVNEDDQPVQTEDGLYLLSPVRVENSDNVQGVIAMHYNPETDGWENVEDAQLRDGYVYGTLTSFSPVAVFTYNKDLEVKKQYLWKNLIAVYANGNPVRVYTDEADRKIIENKMTGKQYILDNNETVLFGGTSDGTPLDKTNISVEAGKYPLLDIKAGSQSPEVNTKLGSINVIINDAEIGCLSGSSGRVQTEEVNFTLNNVKMSWMGAGESITYLKSGNKDANAGFTPDNVNTRLAPYYTNKVNIKANNVTTQLFYVASNTGMTYTNEVNVEANGGNLEYILLCASNGRTGTVKGTLKGVTGTIFQTNNRGIVDAVKATIEDCTIEKLFVAGDSTDQTVTGITKSINLDIGKGTYTLYPGTQGGVEMTAATAAQVVGKVKYSRAADIEFANNVKDVLGDKLVVK